MKVVYLGCQAWQHWGCPTHPKSVTHAHPGVRTGKGEWEGTEGVRIPKRRYRGG